MNSKANTEVRHSSQVTRRVTAAILALPLLAGCATPGASIMSPDALSAVTVSQSAPASTEETEQAEIYAQIKSRAAAAKAAKKAADEAAAAKAASDAAAAKAVEDAVAAKAATQTKAASAAPAPAAGFMGWVNATMARYGVSPGPGSAFVVGNTGFCGGYMCTTTHRYGTTPFKSLTTVSPGAIGNDFALIHEIAHQHGVGFPDTGGECAADTWARQYVQGSIYC